jgi:hypothetical protein
MSNVVFQETSVPGHPSPRRRCVLVSHSCFTGLQHRSRIGSHETQVLLFLLKPLESQVTPELLSPIYSRFVPARSGRVWCSSISEPQRHYWLEGPITLVPRRSNVLTSAGAQGRLMTGAFAPARRDLSLTDRAPRYAWKRKGHSVLTSRVIPNAEFLQVLLRSPWRVR